MAPWWRYLLAHCESCHTTALELLRGQLPRPPSCAGGRPSVRQFPTSPRIRSRAFFFFFFEKTEQKEVGQGLSSR